MCFQVLENLVDALRRIFFRNVVHRHQAADDVVFELPSASARQITRRGLVQLIVTLGIEVDEHALATFEFGDDDVRVRHGERSGHVRAKLSPLSSECHGIFPKVCRQKRHGDAV